MATQSVINTAPTSASALGNRPRRLALLAAGIVLTLVVMIGAVIAAPSVTRVTPTASPIGGDALREFRREEIGSGAAGSSAADRLREFRREEIGAGLGGGGLEALQEHRRGEIGAPAP